MGQDELCFLDAVELAALLRQREVSAREVLDAHLARIERVNPSVNAIVTLTADFAREQARAADELLARGEACGPLHGLPVVHKDLVMTRGIRTTSGSPLFRDFVPDFDDLVVRRQRAAGAITIGKSNTPEFGAGSQTFNPVFGATLNPHDLAKTCGGSSGGAAVALACGMVPIADGSDTGGSLRNPASFCNVVGLRCSPGTVPGGPGSWSPLPVIGPMARSVRDVALLLSVQAGFDPASPLSDFGSGERFASALEPPAPCLRVAFSPNLGGLPVDSRVAAVVEVAARTFSDIGFEVEEATPDLSGADRVFEVFRAHHLATALEDLVAAHGPLVKETIRWNVAEGLRLTSADLRYAAREQAALFARTAAFFERYDALICPTSQVPPFPVDVEYPTSVDGQPMHTYIEWMRSCSRITATAHPAISVPAGFTPEGLPVGLQVVGRYKDEQSLLRVAFAFEQATLAGRRRPALAP